MACSNKLNENRIWVEQDIINSIPTPHIRIYTKSDRSQLVNYYYGCYDLLQYPLLFPYGQSGWHCGIKKIKHSCDTSIQIYCEQEQLPSVMNLEWERNKSLSFALIHFTLE
ncbi:hypothetical protein H5410_015280 [Solanum commersonii]|uniref:Uncharacterized protein n=1 Tax=Solanum commersonii TaxID=4109 RepID=A0A9J5ZTE3_SOLCO|nr:hypothetical protein H5410_015280 [Solanum commersonii]